MTAIKTSDATILIVDDERLLREAIAFDFKRKKFNVMVAGCGQEAIEIVKSTKVNVLLSDVRMPNGDGIELLKNVRKLDREKFVVMFITGFADITPELAFDEGVDAIFSKPFDRKILMDTVLQSLKPREARWRFSPQVKGFQNQIVISAANLESAVRGSVLNIGRGGMFVNFDAQKLPEVNSNINFQIKLGPEEQTCRGTGIVRWTREQNSKELPSGFGVEFIAVDDEFRLKILRTVEISQTKSFIPRK